MLVGPPASRKGAPVAFSKSILNEINATVAVDSSSKRAFTMELAESGRQNAFALNGNLQGQCAISVISKELSSLLAVNPKEMIEVLTDLYDAHDTWDYKTRGQDEDRLFNVCVNCLLATTPTWIAANLPEEAIGGGYTSRHVIVYGNRVYKRISLQTRTNTQERMLKALINDLSHINGIVGEFSFEGGLNGEAYHIYDKWYQGIDDKLRDTADERLKPFIGRMHAMVLKTAMCLTVSDSDVLTFSPDCINLAISKLEDILKTASDAFGGHGRSRTGVDTQRVMDQLRVSGSLTFGKLLGMNYRHVTKSELREILEGLHEMGKLDWGSGDGILKWIGGKK